MSFEKFVFDSIGSIVAGISATEPEEGYTIMLTDAQTISRWVETESFTIDVVKKSRQDASDLKDSVYDAIEDICYKTSGIMSCELNSMTVFREDMPGRWIYTFSVSITHRRDFEWGMK